VARQYQHGRFGWLPVLEDLIKAADLGVKIAKRNGRNYVATVVTGSRRRMGPVIHE
jgi:hypothetical protein